MNKRFFYIFFFIILFSVSCNKFSDKKFYFENIKNDIYFIEILNSQNEKMKDEIIKANNFYPDKVVFWKNIFDRNYLKADSLIQIIENIKLSKFQKLNYSELNFDEINKNGKVKISDAEKQLIFKEIIDYRNFIKEIMPDTSTLLNDDYIFQEEKIENSLNLIIEKNSALKFLSILSKIEVFIKISQFKLNQYLFMNIDCCSYGFSYFSPFCIPFSQTIFFGNDYNSKIIFGADDLTKYSQIVIDNDTVKTNQGFYNFTEKARKDSGKVCIDAKFLLESPSTGKIIEHPFKIEYEVIK